MSIFNERLRQTRIDKGYTQTQLAAMAGISKDLYNKYERTSICPNYDTLLNLTRVLGVSADYLLGKDGPQQEQSIGIEEIKTLIARNLKNISDEQRMELIQQIASMDKTGGTD